MYLTLVSISSAVLKHFPNMEYAGGRGGLMEKGKL